MGVFKGYGMKFFKWNFQIHEGMLLKFYFCSLKILFLSQKIFEKFQNLFLIFLLNSQVPQT